MNLRRRTALTHQEVAARQERLRMKDLSIFARNPRAFSFTFIGLGLLAFFSKPLYDIFFAEPSPMGSHRTKLGGNIIDKGFKIPAAK